MKKNMNDLLIALTKIENEIIESMPNIVKEYAENGLALVINRLHERGIPGESYSQRTTLVTKSVFLQKAKFKPDKVQNKTNKKKHIKFIKFPRASKAIPVMTLQNGYKQLRDIQGLQTANVDVTYTGRMIQNTKILGVENQGEGKAIAIIGGTNSEVKDKLKWNFLHYGNFLGIKKDIAEVINQIPGNRIRDIFKRNL